MVNRVVTEHRAGLNKFDVLGGTSTSHAALMKAGLIARNVTPVRKELRDGFMDAEGYRVAPSLPQAIRSRRPPIRFDLSTLV